MPYYEELDTKRRRDLLAELLHAADDDGTNEWRQRLFAERYAVKKGVETDTYLIHCLMLKNAYAQRKNPLSGFQREAKRELASLHMGDSERLTDVERTALYWEFRNTARRYLDASRSDQYGRKLIGLVTPSADEKLPRIVKDLWTMSRGVALFSGREKEMRPFCDALYDELAAFDIRCEKLYQACEEEYFRDR